MIRRPRYDTMRTQFRLDKDKVGAGVGMAWCGLCTGADKGQHKRVKPGKKEMQGFRPITWLLVSRKRRDVHGA
jgi:hypothetical protein